MKRKEWVIKISSGKSDDLFEFFAIHNLTSFYSETNPSEKEEIFHVYTEDEELIKELAKKFDVSYKSTLSDDKDWLSVWRKNLKIVRIDEDLYVNPDPERLAEPSKGIVINVNLGMAFGTGEHETTKLAALFLKKTLKRGMKVCDVGCGTGILSAIAMKLGADEVLAVDMDENAIKQAKETARLNGVKYEVKKSDLLAQVHAKFDLYVANIVFNVLMKLLPQLPKGVLFIASGIDKPRSDDFARSCEKYEFQIIEKRCENEWCAFLIKT